ncbi:MAG: hypothetical protein IPG01_12635 [Chitinophagaceae bacterium]|nr:hypothetical protein [Chitinophagaceae bacterium]
MIKNRFLLAILLPLCLLGCKTDDIFEGPSLNDLYGSFSLIYPFDIADRDVDFAQGEQTFFTAQFSKNVEWKITIKGLESGSEKEITGFSNSLTESNTKWNGSTTHLPMFKAEVCAVELSFAAEIDTFRDTLSVVSAKLNTGLLLSDFENGLNPGWNSFVQSGANMTFQVKNVDIAAQGDLYYDMGGTVNWDWLIGLVNMPATAYGAKTYDLSPVADNVFFNVMLYKKPEINNALILFQFTEDDNGDGFYTANQEDMFSIEVSLTDPGWQQISSKYSDLATLINGQPGTAIGNGLHEPDKLLQVSVLFLANPTSGYSQTYMDYLIFTENGPLQP